MANTLTVLSRDPNRRRGGELQRTNFSVVVAGAYVGGGEDIDLSSYFRRIISAKITPLQVQPGYEWGVDNTLFATTRHVLAMLFRRGAIAQAQVAAALADHAVHAHAFTSQGLGAPVTNPLGLPAGLNSIEDAGAAAIHTVPGAGATGVQNNAAAQAHAAGAAAVPAGALAEYTPGAYPAGLNFLMEVLGD